jgi:cell wall-associated NlpC family hydrolase
MRDELNAEKQELAKVIEDADGKLDTLALDKAALELRASQLEEQQRTTTTARTTAEESKAHESRSEEKQTVTEGAKTTTAGTDAPANTEAGKKTTTASEKPAETKKTTTATEKVTEPVTETTTEKVTETEPPVVTEPPVTETEPPVSTTEPYVEPEPEPEPIPADDSRQSKIDTVMEYARSNVGGAYVWAGSSFRATDCSGLVMLSYAQIGINMPHLASMQAEYGTAVSYDQLQEGDLVFFGSGYDIYHVAIYNGNGRIVHAANTNDGIIFSDLASFAQYNPIYCMRRII